VDILAYLVIVPSLFLVTIWRPTCQRGEHARISPTQALRYE